MEERSKSSHALLWLLASAACHGALLLYVAGRKPELESSSPFDWPAELEFGLADSPPGGGDARAAPPTAEVRKAPAPRAPKPVKAARDPGAHVVPVKPSRADQPAAQASASEGTAARSGDGKDPDALGAGLGTGIGDGSGYAPKGATIALNVDLARVRKTALLLETEALLDIIPEWQALLAGSGLTPLQDFDRVFVASPTLERANLVVSARHSLARARIEAAVQQLASEAGNAAQFQERDGYPVAAWRNRGPTERVLAITGSDQFAITRASDLERVLDVARALARARAEQGFERAELAAQGGLLAMQTDEAVALWVEGVAKYVRGDAQGVPRSLRMSLYNVDQFNTELRVRGQYADQTAAAEALTAMDGLRKQLSDEPKVVFLGLKSALDKAVITQEGAALLLNVRLTLHQTRYLMRFVTRALRPRSQR